MKRLFLGLALVFLVAPQAQAISRFFEITPENCRKVDVKFDVQVSRKETSPLKVVLGKPTHASPDPKLHFVVLVSEDFRGPPPPLSASLVLWETPVKPTGNPEDRGARAQMGTTIASCPVQGSTEVSSRRFEFDVHQEWAERSTLIVTIQASDISADCYEFFLGGFVNGKHQK